MTVNLYDLEKSPCFDCEYKDRNKDDPGCVKCEKRAAYVLKKNNVVKDKFPITLNQVGSNQVDQDRYPTKRPSSVCSQCGKTKANQAFKFSSNGRLKTICRVCEGINKESPLDENDKVIGDYKGGLKLIIDFDGYENLYKAFEGLAEEQIRTLNQQVLFLIKKAVAESRSE